MIFRILILLGLVLSGCSRAALVLHQQKVTPAYLASTNVGTPDFRRPPNGQMIVAEYWLPKNIRDLHPTLRIHILFQDFTEDCIEFPIHRRIGYETYSVLNDEFKCTGGFLAYRAEIVTSEGDVYADWEHQLWVRLIDLDCETEEMSSAVDAKSMQGSVTDTPLCRSSS